MTQQAKLRTCRVIEGDGGGGGDENKTTTSGLNVKVLMKYLKSTQKLKIADIWWIRMHTASRHFRAPLTRAHTLPPPQHYLRLCCGAGGGDVSSVHFALHSYGFARQLFKDDYKYLSVESV